ncbi:MAG: response regulator [Geminicoccaceae bacterium]|nr:response regulator [Geminicoccaceae bacterium]
MRIFRRSCKEAGVANDVTVAGDGEEALRLLRNLHDGAPFVRPNLIILDINMPRMDGHEFLRELRRDPKLHDSVVFVLTSSNADGDRKRAYAANVAGYIVKSDPSTGFQDVVRFFDRYSQVVELPD